MGGSFFSQDLRRRRRGGLRALTEHLPAREGPRVGWPDLVGASLAEVSALVGARDGTLLVAVANEAARREIVARGDALVGAFNLNARRLGRAEVEALRCWVAEGFRPNRVRERVRARTERDPPELDPAVLLAAREETRRLAARLPPDSREALARIRARLRSRELPRDAGETRAVVDDRERSASRAETER